MHMECQMSVRQECHQGDVTARLYVTDDLQRNEIELSECLGDFTVERLFITAFFGFAIKKIHCQQPCLNIHSHQSPYTAYIITFIIEERQAPVKEMVKLS